MSKLTFDEAIKHCLEVAEQKEHDSAELIDILDELDVDACKECAADHRQLAEWLMELKDLRAEQNDQYVFIRELMDELEEAKRLLKLAVKDFKEINSDILTCKYCKWHSAETGEYAYCPDDVPCEQICGWKYEGEALKLIGGSENG